MQSSIKSLPEGNHGIPRETGAVIAAHKESWAGCQHLVVITEEDEEQQWQKPAGRWIQLDSENSDVSLRKAGGRGDCADSHARKLHS